MSNAITWFEIPAANFDRAVKFYSDVLGAELPQQELNGNKMAFFPCDGQGVGGCVIESDGSKPSEHGTLAYLNGGADLADPLARVEDAGGKVMMPKTKVSEEVGYIAYFLDSEGNKVALHSPNV